MRYRRVDVVDRAIGFLDASGLDGLTMRKFAADLGVAPGALYHHFANKDDLFAAVADELLTRGRRPREIVTWEADLRLACVELRDATLACRDGARLVTRVQALGLGAVDPLRQMDEVLRRAGADEHLARVGARTLVHYVLGHAADAQVQREAAGVVDAPDDGGDFHLGLTLVLDGLRQRVPV